MTITHVFKRDPGKKKLTQKEVLKILTPLIDALAKQAAAETVAAHYAEYAEKQRQTSRRGRLDGSQSK